MKSIPTCIPSDRSTQIRKSERYGGYQPLVMVDVDDSYKILLLVWMYIVLYSSNRNVKYCLAFLHTYSEKTSNIKIN